MQITLSEFVNFVEKNDKVNTRGYVERLNNKSTTGCNISTYLGLVSNTTKRDALEWTCFDRERERSFSCT